MHVCRRITRRAGRTHKREIPDNNHSTCMHYSPRLPGLWHESARKECRRVEGRAKRASYRRVTLPESADQCPAPWLRSTSARAHRLRPARPSSDPESSVDGRSVWEGVGLVRCRPRRIQGDPTCVTNSPKTIWQRHDHPTRLLPPSSPRPRPPAPHFAASKSLTSQICPAPSSTQPTKTNPPTQTQPNRQRPQLEPATGRGAAPRPNAPTSPPNAKPGPPGPALHHARVCLLSSAHPVRARVHAFARAREHGTSPCTPSPEPDPCAIDALREASMHARQRHGGSHTACASVRPHAPFV